MYWSLFFILIVCHVFNYRNNPWVDHIGTLIDRIAVFDDLIGRYADCFAIVDDHFGPYVNSVAVFDHIAIWEELC